MCLLNFEKVRGLYCFWLLCVCRVHTDLEESLNLTLVPENSWNFKIVPFVLELSWKFVKLPWKCEIVLEIIKYTDSFPFFWIYAMCERKLGKNRWICWRSRGHGAPIQFTGSPGMYQYHNENISVIEMKCDLIPNRRFRQKQSKIAWKSMKLSPWKLKKVLELSWKSPEISFSCFCMNPGMSYFLYIYQSLKLESGNSICGILIATVTGIVIAMLKLGRLMCRLLSYLNQSNISRVMALCNFLYLNFCFTKGLL